MPPDPYCNLAEILEGTVSLMNYYARRMDQTPSSLGPAKAALQRTIEELLQLATCQQAAD